MSGSFILSCESTVDMPYSYIRGRDIPVLFYTYDVAGRLYEDDMGRDPEAMDRFYSFLEGPHLPSTSQINEQEYEEFLGGLLEKGDVLHVAFGSGMSNAVANAFAAAEELRERYPERKLIVIDSLCSSSGYGLLVDMAADMRDTGKPIEEVEEWLLANRNKVHHQFFSTDLTFFRRSGRMSGPAAMIATILNICPIMHLNCEGRIIAYDKVRGKRNAIKRTVSTMKEHVQNGTDYDGKCFICNSRCLEEAQELRDEIEEQFPHLKDQIRIFDIGTIIAAHSGPGTTAVFFMGDERGE